MARNKTERLKDQPGLNLEPVKIKEVWNQSLERYIQVSFKEFIHTATENRLSGRSAYYSGRGPNRGDLNEKHLDQLYAHLVKEYDELVGARFIIFCEGLEDYSATAFIDAFQYFYESGFVTMVDKGEAIVVEKDKNGNYDMMSGMAGMAAFMGRNADPDRDRIGSNSIKYSFLRRFGVGPKRGEVTVFGPYGEIYDSY